jgi:hypothetical protein
MRGNQKCNEMGLTVQNVRARFFEKGAFPQCPSTVLVYSSPCRTFCPPLSLYHPPTSVTTLPLPVLLQCPNDSRHEMLTSMFALTAFALRC